MSANASVLSLRSRVLRAGGWTLGGHAATQMLRLASNLVMTRLLMPDMFGVMAVAMVFIVGLNMFSDLGLRQVVVQNKRGEESEFLDTVWGMQILRGLVICTAGIGLAVALAWAAGMGWLPGESTYARPELPWVIGAVSLTALIAGFESTRLLTASRNLSLKGVTMVELASQAAGMAIMIPWALLSPGIEALVAGAFAASLMRMVMSHLVLPGSANRLRWNSAAAQEIFGFGKWVFLTSIMGFLINSGDRLLLGWFIPAATMGLYAIAVLLAGALQEVVNKLVGSVAFPALGEINREQPQRIRELYYRLRWPIDVFCLFSAGFLFMAGNSIVGVLYDARYTGAGAMLGILSLSLFALRYGVAGQFYLVLGKPQVIASLMVLRLIVMAISIPFGFHLGGLIGAVWGVVLAGLPGLLITLFVIKRSLGLLDLRKELSVLIFMPIGVLAGFMMGLAL